MSEIIKIKSGTAQNPSVIDTGSRMTQLVGDNDNSDFNRMTALPGADMRFTEVTPAPMIYVT